MGTAIIWIGLLGSVVIAGFYLAAVMLHRSVTSIAHSFGGAIGRSLAKALEVDGGPVAFWAAEDVEVKHARVYDRDDDRWVPNEGHRAGPVPPIHPNARCVIGPEAEKITRAPRPLPRAKPHSSEGRVLPADTGPSSDILRDLEHDGEVLRILEEHRRKRGAS